MQSTELGLCIGTDCPQEEMLTHGKKRKTFAGYVKDIFRIITITGENFLPPSQEGKLPLIKD